MIKSCQKQPSCHLPVLHFGACQDRKGKLIPKVKKVDVIEVVSRDSNSKPGEFRTYQI